MIQSIPDTIKKKLFFQISIVVMFLFSLIFLLIWTGNTLSTITAIARFERTHSVSRVEGKAALLEYLNTREAYTKEVFYQKMAITQSYNKLFGSLLDLRTSASKEQFTEIVENTFKEADYQTAVTLVNRIEILYWHPIVKELVGYASRANSLGEDIISLATQAMSIDAAKSPDRQKYFLGQIEEAERKFMFYEFSFSKRCSDLSNEIADFVNYFSIAILIISMGLTGLIIYLLANSVLQQANKHADELERSQERLNLVIKGSNDAPWDWDLVTDELYYSPQWWAQIGYQPDEIPADATLWQKLLDPRDQHKIDSLFKAVFEEGINSYELEFRLRHKEGHYVYVLSRGIITRNSAGTPIRVTGTNMDLTERKKAEAERERLIQCIEQSGEATIITDAEGIIQNVNKAFEDITGFSRQEAVGKTPRIVKSGKHESEFYEKLWSIISSGGTFQGQLINKRKDGTLYTESATISPVFDDSGKIVNYIGVKQDITSNLEMENQLRQAQKMDSIGQLAGGVAHDYNNGLSVILGFTELIMDKVEPDSPIYEDLQEVHNAATRSAAVTRQLLAFARKQTVVPKVLKLNETVSGILKMLKRLIGENIELVWNPDASLWCVHMDPSQIDQILANLCVNARHAITGVGKIVIETGNIKLDKAFCETHPDLKAGDYVMLSVSDDGKGISKEDQEKIFEPFYTTMEVGEGTGLGLATVYGIVKQNKGLINLYSEVGQGTTFKIYLPRHEQERDEEIIVQSAEAVLPSGSGEKILIVEDEPATLRLARRILTGLGYTVVDAVSTRQALHLAKEHENDLQLLLTDVIMSEMNGLDLAKIIQKDHPNLKVLFMSGYTADIISRQGVLPKGLNLIQKPFTRAELAVMVRKELDK